MMVETFRRSGTNVDMGPQLSQVFLDAGLPTPTICSDVLVGAEEWMPAVLYSIRSRMRELGLPIETLGDFDSLIERLGAEVAAASAPTPLPSLASAWCRKE